MGRLKAAQTVWAPEGAEFTRKATEDLGKTIMERDAPFGDYGQEQR